jgi:hypothetical protein
LREAVDAGMLVNKASGMHDVPIVLSLAHNVACAMAYLHQVSHRQTLGFRACISISIIFIVISKSTTATCIDLG